MCNLIVQSRLNRCRGENYWDERPGPQSRLNKVNVRKAMFFETESVSAVAAACRFLGCVNPQYSNRIFLSLMEYFILRCQAPVKRPSEQRPMSPEEIPFSAGTVLI